MKRLLGCFAVATFVLGCASSASASTIWYLQNVVFNDPVSGFSNTATGSFQVNDGPTGIEDWSIAVTGTNLAFNHLYDKDIPGEQGFFNPTIPPAIEVSFADAVFAHILNLSLASPMTDSGGTIALLLRGPNGFGDDSSYVCFPINTCVYATSGQITTSPIGAVPEPATLSLLALGLIGIRARARRRANALVRTTPIP